jgi:hypothetical protein
VSGLSFLWTVPDIVFSSLVLGLVGAGGIGRLTNQALKSFSFLPCSHIIIVVLLIIIVDKFSAAVRPRLSAEKPCPQGGTMTPICYAEDLPGSLRGRGRLPA